MTRQYDPLEGLQFNSTSMILSVKNLQLLRGWAMPPYDYGSDTELSILYFQGHATSERDGIRVSGSSEIFRNFNVTLRSAASAQSRWSDIKQATSGKFLDVGLSEASILARMTQSRDEEFDDKPPTAELYFLSSYEVPGVERGVSIECLLPSLTLERLAEDWGNGLSEVALTIHWKIDYVDNQNGRVNVPTTRVLVRLNAERDPEPLLGYLERISWTPKRR